MLKKNKNGIRVHTPSERKKRIPLDYALDMMTFTKTVEGVPVEITVPKFSPVRSELKKDGWRVAR